MNEREKFIMRKQKIFVTNTDGQYWPPVFVTKDDSLLSITNKTFLSAVSDP